MKRRSMLGRRQSRQLQSPAAPTSNFRPPASTLRPPTSSIRNVQSTPDKPRGQLDNPFRTPSVNGSLTEIANNEDPWSVFKSVRNGLKSPSMLPSGNDVVWNSQGGLHKRESALKNNYNRRKEQKLAEKLGGAWATSSEKTRNFNFAVYKHQRAGAVGVSKTEKPESNPTVCGFAESSSNNRVPGRSATGGGPETRSRGSSSQSNPLHRLESSLYKHSANDDKSVSASKANREYEAERTEIRENATESCKNSRQGSQSPWECQDIRDLSPPWSNGLNTLNDFNLLTPQPPSRVTSSPVVIESGAVDLCNSLAFPLETTVLENTTAQATVTPQAKENKDEKLDLKTALSDVSLGVGSIELLDKHGVGGWSTTSWASRTPLHKLPEEPGESKVLDKENLPPDQQEVCADEQQSQPADETFLSPSLGSSSSSKAGWKDMTQHLQKLLELNGKIELAEKERDSAEEKIRALEEKIRLAVGERRAAEEKRRKLENERTLLNSELLQEMSQAPSVYGVQSAKRRKVGPLSAKKGPSFVASKILRRDFSRTPRQSLNASLSVNSFLNPFTPRTLRKNLNDQYDQIFGN